jgi:urea transport system ATP-binding protein
VPQGRDIFPRLTVAENLEMGLATRRKRGSVPGFVFDMFPVLKDMLGRRGGDLSGGQQQQLAIGRALAMQPKLLILDEPTEGIQPSIIKDLARTLNQIKAERKLSIVLAEQVLSFALEISDRFVIIEKGEFVYEGARDSVDKARIHSYLTI